MSGPFLPALAVLALAAMLAACGGSGPPEGHASQTREEAVARSGDVSIRASVIPAAWLNPAMAREYDITPGPRSALLLVGVRQGPPMQETALPARISVRVTDLRGVRQTVDMREIRSPAAGAGPDSALIDYIGIVRIAPPDTLRFELEVEHAAGTPSQLQFSRDIYR